MSGPNPPEPDSPKQQPEGQPTPEHTDDTGLPAQAYSAPESEQVTGGPYVPADPGLYDYDNFDASTELVDELQAPRWPWAVGVAAIVAAISLVASVAVLVTRTDTSDLASPSTTTSAPPVQDEITTPTAPPPPLPPTEEPPPPPPPPETVTVTQEPPPMPPAPAPAPPAETEGPPPPPPAQAEAPPPATATTPAGPRQVTYSVTGTKSPGDIISVTYVDASGRSRTQRNVYIPWSLTVTPISRSEFGSVRASSFFRVSKLNCSITTSEGTVVSSNTSNAAQTSC